VLEPNVDVLGDLFLRSGRICRQPVAAKPVKTATIDRQSSGKSKAKAAGRANNDRKQKASGGTARSKPAAPPPDIGAGIGIGGVF
jgi:hypothetical protein